MALFNKKTDDKKADAQPAVKSDVKPVVKTPAAPETKTDVASSMKDLYQEQGGKTVKGEKTGKKITGQAYRILIKPLVTEKATTLGTQNKYVFMVANDANKISVAQAIVEVYGIKPTDVNIIKSKGKRVLRGQIAGRRKNWKKAIVTLPAGKNIKIYEGV